MIRELLARARSSEPPRNPQRAAVSDVFQCDRRTWFRRNGFQEPPPTEALLRKFEIGHAVEAQIARRLGDLGVWVERDVLVALKPFSVTIPIADNVLFARDMHARVVRCRCIPDWECTCADKVPMDEMTGHPDLWLSGGNVFPEVTKKVLIEVKTTDVRNPKPECEPHYALQAATYALALDADECRVHVTHVVPFEKPEAEYVVDHLALRPRVVQRLHEVMERTYPGAPMPAPEPPMESAAFACKFCPYGQCEKNRNPESTIVPAPELPV